MLISIVAIALLLKHHDISIDHAESLSVVTELSHKMWLILIWKHLELKKQNTGTTII